VVEPALPHVAVTEHVDAIDPRRVHEKRALNADAVRDTPHREVLAQPASGDADDRALEHLDALSRALDHLGVDLDRVAGAERGHLCLLLLFLELLDDVHFNVSSWIYISAAERSARGAAPPAACATGGSVRGRLTAGPLELACRETRPVA